ncbi:hypothetical protein F0U47_20595, partial [Nocardioides antri]
DDVFVPDGLVVGEVDHGWGVARTTLAGERVAHSQKMDAYASDKDLQRFARGGELSPVARHQPGERVAESQSI